jgi:hypothetical protein
MPNAMAKPSIRAPKAIPKATSIVCSRKVKTIRDVGIGVLPEGEDRELAYVKCLNLRTDSL